MNDIDKVNSKEALLALIDQGRSVHYLCFWGHRPEVDGSIGKGCLSQWFEAGFEVEGVYYPTAEHYMMGAKARLFDDAGMFERITQAPDPGKAKALGRKVEGFDNDTWLAHRFDIVVAGNMAKFAQNPALKNFLLGTGERVLVEASPRDTIWGIGLGQGEKAEDPRQWRGLNLLGFALMQVRERLRRT